MPRAVSRILEGRHVEMPWAVSRILDGRHVEMPRAVLFCWNNVCLWGFGFGASRLSSLSRRWEGAIFPSVVGETSPGDDTEMCLAAQN